MILYYKLLDKAYSVSHLQSHLKFTTSTAVILCFQSNSICGLQAFGLWWLVRHCLNWSAWFYIKYHIFFRQKLIWPILIFFFWGGGEREGKRDFKNKLKLSFSNFLRPPSSISFIMNGPLLSMNFFVWIKSISSPEPTYQEERVGSGDEIGIKLNLHDISEYNKTSASYVIASKVHEI